MKELICREKKKRALKSKALAKKVDIGILGKIRISSNDRKFFET